ncbi:aluminum-activated malate transporter 9 [Selaginella moellendorffii]|nr:aluminum-activated malate transporter 9 [Selaginella moellendorffii]|eukprot:XP_002992826.2 aluminum-activated malate transporter 9 [Selaginella moellendorffii]
MQNESGAVEVRVSPEPIRERDEQQGEEQQQQQQQQQQHWSKWFLFQDPRRLIHAAKVGLALSLSSLFMLVEEPPRLLGENAIWAIKTVVVVFEFTVGATLSKGLNRGLGTLAAAFLGLGIAHLADFCGHIGEASIIITSVFLAGAVATFLRFIPKLKAKYDYGLLIFMLTFSLISVSSYQTSETSFKTASTRMFTILVGCGISLVICMFLFPVWAGEDLHALSSRNFETLADCLQGSVEEYLKIPETTMQAVMEKEIQNRADNDDIYVKYRALLSSSQTEESLANFAGWEPPHGKFLKCGYPWPHYVKVGAALRHCAYASMALHGCVRAEVQAPYELRQVFGTEILKVTKSATELLRQVSVNIRNMEHCQENVDALLVQMTASTESLQEFIDAHSHLFIHPTMATAMIATRKPSNTPPTFEYSTDPESPFSNSSAIDPAPRTIHRLATMGSYTSLSMQSIRSASNFSVATFTSLLIETVARLENLVEAAECLAELARFKEVTSASQQKIHRRESFLSSVADEDIVRRSSAPNTSTE